VQLGQCFNPSPILEPKHTPTTRTSKRKPLKIDLKKMVSTLQQNSFLKKGHTQTPIFYDFLGSKPKGKLG
jgi:hypothetical protein